MDVAVVVVAATAADAFVVGGDSGVDLGLCSVVFVVAYSLKCIKGPDRTITPLSDPLHMLQFLMQ